jgi:hypothetical protein
MYKLQAARGEEAGRVEARGGVRKVVGMALLAAWNALCTPSCLFTHHNNETIHTDCVYYT